MAPNGYSIIRYEMHAKIFFGITRPKPWGGLFFSEKFRINK